MVVDDNKDLAILYLTRLSPDNMATILPPIISDAFSWMKIIVFWLKFYWSLLQKVQLTIALHWFR